MLKIQKVFHQYQAKAKRGRSGDRKYSLNNISFDLLEGELLAIVGETGSGKTTLLKIIAGQEIVSKGQVVFEGKRVLGPHEQLIPGHPEIALVAQDFQLFPHHTVYDNLEYQLRKHKATSIDKRIKELLSFFGLSQHKHKKPSQLSGGQQQKLALAKALSHRPKVLLLDEPFAHLDLIQTQAYKQEIQRLIKELNVAVILVTHIVQDAFGFANQIMVLQKGKLIQKAPPTELYKQPKNAYIAELTGTANLLTGNELKQVLTKSELKKIKGFELDKSYCFRPQYVIVETVAPTKKIPKNQQATIQKIEFEGLFYSFELLTKEGLIIKSVAFKNHWLVGEQIAFEVEAKFVHEFT